MRSAWCCTSCSPEPGPSPPPACTRAALEHAIVQVDPPPPSRAAADAVRARALRGDLDTIVLKAMKKQPADRYASATALADDLHRLLCHEPVRAQRDSGWYRARKFATRNALPLGLGAALAVALIGLSGAALWQARAASESAEQANTIKEFLLSIIRQGDPLASAQNRASDLALLIAAKAASRRNCGRNRSSRSDAARDRQRLRQPRRVRACGAHVARQYRDGTPALPATDLTLIAAQIRMADPLIVDGAEAEADLDRVIDALQAGRPTAPGLLVDALLQRHKLWRWSGDPEKALGHAMRALAFATDADVNDEARALLVANELALMLSSAGRAPQALGIVEPAYRRAIQSGAFAPCRSASDSRHGPGTAACCARTAAPAKACLCSIRPSVRRASTTARRRR